LACSSPPSPSTPSSNRDISKTQAPRPKRLAARVAAFGLILCAVPASLVVRRALHHGERVDPRSTGAAPAFALQSLDGRAVSLAGFAGRPVVVNFFGGWCEQCVNELPLLVELRRRHPGLDVVGILFKESVEAGHTAAEQGGADWPVLVDPGGKVAAAYGVDGGPATFFIRADGTIAGDLLGPVSIGLLDKQFEKISPSR
jgi:cytochrome c biogenesis protein CcmG/thiol:disulfide interchange protein DsbE